MTQRRVVYYYAETIGLPPPPPPPTYGWFQPFSDPVLARHTPRNTDWDTWLPRPPPANPPPPILSWFMPLSDPVYPKYTFRVTEWVEWMANAQGKNPAPPVLSWFAPLSDPVYPKYTPRWTDWTDWNPLQPAPDPDPPILSWFAPLSDPVQPRYVSREAQTADWTAQIPPPNPPPPLSWFVPLSDPIPNWQKYSLAHSYWTPPEPLHAIPANPPPPLFVGWTVLPGPEIYARYRWKSYWYPSQAVLPFPPINPVLSVGTGEFKVTGFSASFSLLGYPPFDWKYAYSAPTPLSPTIEFIALDPIKHLLLVIFRAGYGLTYANQSVSTFMQLETMNDPASVIAGLTPGSIN